MHKKGQKKCENKCTRSRWENEKQKKKEKKKEKRNPKDVNRNVNNTRDDNVVVAVAAPLLAVVADALCRVYFTPSAALHPPYASSPPPPLTVAHPTRPCFMAEPSEAKTLAIKQKSKAPAAAAAASADESKEQRKEQNKIKQKKQRQQKKQSKATPVECSSNITPTLCRQGSKERVRERDGGGER